MNTKLEQAAEFQETQFLNALDTEDRRQSRISYFADELLGGHQVATRIGLERTYLSKLDVISRALIMADSGDINDVKACSGLIDYFFSGKHEGGESKSDWFKANISLAAAELVSDHYDSIIEESSIDNAV